MFFVILSIYAQFKQYETRELSCFMHLHTTYLISKYKLNLFEKYNKNIPLKYEDRIHIDEISKCLSTTACYVSQKYYVGQQLNIKRDHVYYGCKYDMYHNISIEEKWQIYECKYHFCNYRLRDSVFRILCHCNLIKYCLFNTIKCKIDEMCWVDGRQSRCENKNYKIKNSTERLCSNYLCNSIFDNKQSIECYTSRSFLDIDTQIVNTTRMCHECVIAMILTPFGFYYSQNCKSLSFPRYVIQKVCKTHLCNNISFLKELVYTGDGITCFSQTGTVKCHNKPCRYNLKNNGVYENCDYDLVKVKLDKDIVLCNENYCNKKPYINNYQNRPPTESLKCANCENCKTTIGNHTFSYCDSQTIACFIYYTVSLNDWNYKTGCLSNNKNELQSSEQSFTIKRRYCYFTACNNVENALKYSPKHKIICNNCTEYRNGYCVSQGIVLCYTTSYCRTKYKNKRFADFSCGSNCNGSLDKYTICCKGDYCNNQHISVESDDKSIKCYSCKKKDCLYKSSYCKSSMCYMTYSFMTRTYKLGCDKFCKPLTNSVKHVRCCNTSKCNIYLESVNTEIRELEHFNKKGLKNCSNCKLITSICSFVLLEECSNMDRYCLTNREFIDGQWDVQPAGCSRTCKKNKTTSCCETNNCNNVVLNMDYYGDESKRNDQKTTKEPFMIKQIRYTLVIFCVILAMFITMITVKFILVTYTSSPEKSMPLFEKYSE